MRSLALDTSSNVLSLGLFEEDQLIIEVTSNVSEKHGTFLLPLVEKVFHTVNWDIGTIDQIWLGRGPGSYTGLRIGATMAKIWTASKKIQLESFSSLAIMAGQVAVDECQSWIIPVMDARRGTAYTAAYQWEDGLLKSRIKDNHVDWQSWIQKTLLQQFNQTNLKHLILVSAHENELIDFVRKELSQQDIQLHIITGQFAWPRVGKALYIDKKLVEDIDVFEPFYAHLTLAEQEWAAKQTNQEQEKNESYVEKTNETNI